MGSGSKKKHSLGQECTPQSGEAVTPTARKGFLEQVSRLLTPEETLLPENVVLVSGSEDRVSNVVSRLIVQYTKVLQPINGAEVKAVLNAILNKMYKHCCNSSAKSPTPVKLVLIGGDFIVSSSLRQYVDLLSTRPVEWQGYIRFYVVPFGGNGVARYLASVDSLYAALFPPTFIDILEIKAEELVSRIQRYVSSSQPPTVQMPIAEAMLTCHDDSSQIFIPFVNEVRVGPGDSASTSLSVDLDENAGAAGAASAGTGPLLSSSPPAPPLTPPSSPNVQTRELPWEPLELQLDYWQAGRPGDASKPGKLEGKCSLKGVFRSLQVSRLPPLGHAATNNFLLTMNYTTKEKKQKSKFFCVFKFNTGI